MKSKQESIYNLFWIFIVASVCGWFIEGTWTLLKRGVLINHSAVVIGPFNMAYGISACFLSALLYKYRDDKLWKIFIVGFIVGSIIEYVMSLGMELLLGFTAWDYSRKLLNINGRICLAYSIFWGLLSILWIKFIYSYLEKILKKLNNNKWYIFTLILIVFLILDILLTFCAVYRARQKEVGVDAKYRYEIILDKTFNQDYLKNMYNNNWGGKR
ncbi:hypothetical protein EGR52_09890 [bacterium]|nr:hypothetical protein [bacterium]